MSTKRLLLWDIDGTLISTGAAGQGAIIRATAEQFGGDGNLDGVEIAGRTDLAIAQQILQKYGAPVTDSNARAFLDIYLQLLSEELPRRQGRVLPGVLELLERLDSQPDTTLGLLTGNLERGAKLKLEHYDLWRFFAFGGFADDHHDRNQIGPFALARALKGTGIKFAGS
ncbi:MAG TPA: haloacid dehalogenase-like hydrolase, partial [Chthoniobacterales bacterium]